MNKIILSFLLFLSVATVAQTVPAPVAAPVDSTKNAPAPDSSLKGQYGALLSRSKSYYGYKLINPSRLAAFYTSVTDSIRKERNRGKAAQASLVEQKKTIDTLNSQIKGSETALQTSTSKLDEISFLGIPFSKSTYNTIVWSIIIVLAIALAIVVIRSAKNIHDAKYRTELYDEIAKEYQAYKSKANEKEKKLARELQDERNKLDEFKNRGI
jgi:Skp family chaperone for outer membrane proteins